MTDFKAKLHQIRFRLGLRPRPRWGSLPPSCIWGPLRGRGGLLGKRRKRGRKGGGSGGEGKGGPQVTVTSEPCYATAAAILLHS